MALQPYSPPPAQLEISQAEEPLQQSTRGRWILVILSLLWLPSALIALALLSGRWLVGEQQSLLRAMLWAVIGAQTVLSTAGWAAAGWRWLQQRRSPVVLPPEELTLADLQAMSPAEFEAWVTRFFARRGYHAVNTPDVGDDGVDIHLTDPQGRKAIAQCKRYQGTVGAEVVRELYGTVAGEDAFLGYLVTTGRISDAARRWAQGKPLELIDGERLVRLANATW